MSTDLRTRVELTCWNLIIPMMTKLRDIRTITAPKPTNSLTSRQFIVQIVIWSSAGLFIGFGLSAIHALLW